MAETQLEDGQTKVAERLAAEALIVDVDGFEGPLDLLLTLSRTQKGRSAQNLGAATGTPISDVRGQGQGAAA